MYFLSTRLLDFLGDERNVLEKVFYSWLVAIVFRCRYYMAWKICECVCVRACVCMHICVCVHTVNVHIMCCQVHSTYMCDY